jgi:ribosomal protein L28
MANICYICGKKAVFGSSQKHRRGVAGKRWKNRVTATPRMFRPNLQPYTIEVAGKPTRVTLCAKCIKRQKFNASRAYLSA